MQHVQKHSPLPVHDSPAGRQGFARPRRNIAALGIQTGMHIADFGAGSGAYTLAIAERLEETGKVYAIDVQRDLLRRITSEAAHRGLKNIEVIWADLETPRASKLADGSTDLVLISNVLFQVPDKQLVLEEARRIVKPTGSVAVIDWIESFGGMGPQREDVFSMEAALAFAKKSGLALTREFPAGAHHYGLVFRPTPTT